MGTISIPSITNSWFINGTPGGTQYPVDADRLNADIAAIVALFVAGIDDDNVLAISDIVIDFDAATGHDHDGTDSKLISGTPESGIRFNISSGHTHNDTDSDKLALAIANGDRGAVKIATGSVAINAITGRSVNIDLSAGGYGSFTETPFLLSVFPNLGGSLDKSDYGIGQQLLENVAVPAQSLPRGYWTRFTEADGTIFYIQTDGSALFTNPTYYFMAIGT